MAYISYRFPEGFVWGVAAASAQIEGAAREDGKGESIWDRFSAIPGHIADGTSPQPACDHFHRFPQDIALMRELGVQNYRLSIAWPRLFPSGGGALNQPGLDFYDRLTDALLEAGITPWVTLFHWDLPQVLEDADGWLNRDTALAFGRYAEAVVKNLGDRVHNWFTLNEMPCFIGLGYKDGIHAPGRTESAARVNQGYHHALLAHGLGVRAVREHGGPNARVGLVHNPPTPLPLSETDADCQAARLEYERANGQLMAPVYQGHYSEEFLRSAGQDAPRVQPGDMELIHEPGDFLGLNLYAGYFVRAVEREGQIEPQVLPFPRGFPKGDLPWINITPQTLYWAVRHAHQSYGVRSFHITENGMAADDEVTPKGEILDLDRREYIRGYLVGLHRAIEEGFNVRGYFAWTWMDNFEWAEGTSKRFGLVHNDYETQARTPKLSARWFSQVMAENRIV